MSTIMTRFNKVVLMIVAAGVISGPAFACATKTDNDNKGNSHGSDARVTICHATSSQTNPYVVATVSTSSIDEKNNKDLNGHGDHTGGVWYQGIAAHSWGDIIPAFTSPKGAQYAGQNMNEAGRAILNNGCKIKVTTPKKDEDKPVQALPAKTNDDKTTTVKVASTAVSELPHTGAAANTLGLVGVAGAATYAVARRFMK